LAQSPTEKGYYFVNNVPVGTYTLRAQFIGFAPSEVRNVRVTRRADDHRGHQDAVFGRRADGHHGHRRGESASCRAIR